jgi:hypothetical protein
LPTYNPTSHEYHSSLESREENAQCGQSSGTILAWNEWRGE